MKVTAVAILTLALGGSVVCVRVALADRGTLAAGDQIALSPIPPPPDVDGPPAGAKRTATGLATLTLRRGTGKNRPTKDDSVIVDFTGWTSDGKMFDSSVARGGPARLWVNGTIAGLSEALQLMVIGEKRRLWVPEALGFRPRRHNERPARGPLARPNLRPRRPSVEGRPAVAVPSRHARRRTCSGFRDDRNDVHAQVICNSLVVQGVRLVRIFRPMHFGRI